MAISVVSPQATEILSFNIKVKKKCTCKNSPSKYCIHRGWCFSCTSTMQDCITYHCESLVKFQVPVVLQGIYRYVGPQLLNFNGKIIKGDECVNWN